MFVFTLRLWRDVLYHGLNKTHNYGEFFFLLSLSLSLFTTAVNSSMAENCGVKNTY